VKILIYDLNYAPEITGIGQYIGELGAWLASKTHQVKVVAAPPYYPDWQIGEEASNKFQKKSIDGVEVYQCPLYVPNRPTILRRLLHLISFVLSSTLTLIALI
jgi:colanic acid biosynthesis glycosyl transferase WcaI